MSRADGRDLDPITQRQLREKWPVDEDPRSGSNGYAAAGRNTAPDRRERDDDARSPSRGRRGESGGDRHE